jgi:hypothetical protein
LIGALFGDASRSSKISEVPPAARATRSIVRLLTIDAQLDVREKVEALARNRLLALETKTEGVSVGVQAPERRDDAREHLGAIAVATGRDGLGHLRQRLPVLVGGHRGRILAGRFDIDVPLAQNLCFQLQKALAMALSCGNSHTP